MTKPKQFDQLEILNDEDRLFKSWGSVEIKDKQGEIIPIDEFKKIMLVMMKRGGVIIDSHSNRPVGNLLNYEFKEKNGKDGLLLTGQVFSDYESDDVVWDNVKSGNYKGMSFGGMNKEKSYNSKENADVLTELSGFEFSLVEEPANPEALMEEVNLVAKSDVKKGPRCMSLLEERGLSKEESHDICYADDIEEGKRESMVKSDINKPEKLDRCVADLMADPDFKPKNSSQTKEQAAFAVCTESLEKSKSDLSKKVLQESYHNSKKGGIKMSENKLEKQNPEETTPMEETQEISLQDVAEQIKILQSQVSELNNKIGSTPGMEKRDEEEEEKEPEEEMEKRDHKDEDKDKDKEKKKANGSIETVTSTDVAQDEEDKPPKTDTATAIKALKKEVISEIKKEFNIKSTPRPTLGEGNTEIIKGGVKKFNPLDIAQGRIKMNMGEIIQKQMEESDNALKQKLGYL